MDFVCSLGTRAALIAIALCAAMILAKNCDSDSKSEDCKKGGGQNKTFNQDNDWDKANSTYDFHATDIYGKDVPLSRYRGHVSIILNVASQCTLTEMNYKQLMSLYTKYGKSDGLKILAFPSNQFASQEPGTSQEILEFTKRLNVTFDIFEKIEVNGENAHPLFKWLRSQSGSSVTPGKIEWNFTKFIINKEGQVVYRSTPKTEPLELEPTLKKLF